MALRAPGACVRQFKGSGSPTDVVEPDLLSGPSRAEGSRRDCAANRNTARPTEQIQQRSIVAPSRLLPRVERIASRTVTESLVAFFPDDEEAEVLHVRNPPPQRDGEAFPWIFAAVFIEILRWWS